jgi:hypothetical protein
MNVTLVNRKLMAQRLKAVDGFEEAPEELSSRLLEEAGKTMTISEFAEMLIGVIMTLDTHQAVKVVLLTMTDDFVDAMIIVARARAQARIEIEKVPRRRP